MEQKWIEYFIYYIIVNIDSEKMKFITLLKSNVQFSMTGVLFKIHIININ